MSIDPGKVRGDLLAGLTTAVMLIPQGMAYALLAGLPPVVGLYAALVPPLGYALVGSSRELSVGPVAMDSLLVFSTLSSMRAVTPENYAAVAALLALCVGALQVLMGGLRLGYLVNFLSQPVLSGFTSAAALLIAASQASQLLGVQKGSGTTIIDLTVNLWGSLHEVSPPTVIISCLSFGLLLGFKKFIPRAPGPILVLVIATFATLALGFRDHVSVVGSVPPGLPAFRLPQLDRELIMALLPGALTIALVAFMESIAVARAYAKKNRYPIYPDRELIALGTANVLGGLFQGFPVAGGFSRTAVNAQAGARTSLAAIVASALVGVSLVSFTRLFSYVPKASLAAIIVVAVIALINVGDVRSRYHVKRSDAALLVVTFVATTTLGIMLGLGIGIAASVLWFVIRSTRPHFAVLGRVPGTTQFRNTRRYPDLFTDDGILIVRMDAQLYFANIAFMRDRLRELEAKAKAPLEAVIIDATPMNNVDTTAVELLEELYDDYAARGVAFYLAGVKGHVGDMLDRAGILAKMGCAASCSSIDEALKMHLSTSRSPPARLMPDYSGS